MGSELNRLEKAENELKEKIAQKEKECQALEEECRKLELDISKTYHDIQAHLHQRLGEIYNLNPYQVRAFLKGEI